jgi:hypothetical protein
VNGKFRLLIATRNLFYTRRRDSENKAKHQERLMRSATLERLESLLESRKLAGTLTSRAPEAVESPARSTGVDALDVMLGGGWRQGEVSEIIGPRSSGRTSLLMATLASATGQGSVVALVDAFDRFDPVTAAQAGLDLDRVLWVRGPALSLDHRHSPAGRAFSDEVVSKAIRALDLIVRAGGFAVAALDLADVPSRHLRVLPFTTWMRLAHAVEGRDTACLLVGDEAIGKSARGVSVRLDTAARWSGTSTQGRRFAGFDVHARIASARTIGTGQPRWMAGTGD